MSLGSRIKELREDKNISRNKLADLLGVTVGAISNYENEISSPKEPILFKIMEVLNCDANYLFQDAINIHAMEHNLSIGEYKIIEKYRSLDGHGREMVDFTLEKEYERSAALKDDIVEISSHHRHLEPQAAHNDYSYDEEQQKLMKEDLDDL